MTTRTRILLAATLSLTLLPGLAAAQLGNCGPDVEKFCKGVAPGRGRLLRCLEGHAQQLSPLCKAAIGVHTLSSSDSSCKKDVVKFCSDAGTDREKIKKCLQSHAAQLSDACKTAMIAHGG